MIRDVPRSFIHNSLGTNANEPSLVTASTSVQPLNLTANETLMMDAVRANLDPITIDELHEVANGMLKIYRTLVEMQYLEETWINKGPHDMTAWLPVCRRLGIDDSIIYLYSILPYVNNHDAMDLEFYRGGRFIDFRDEEAIVAGRDPMFAGDEERREHMRPWMTPLSDVGNEDTALLYDSRKHCIGIYAMMDGDSSDPYVGEVEYSDRDRLAEERAERERLEWEQVGGEYPESSEEDEDEEEEDDDENIWDEMDARHAPFVLRDIVSWHRDLSELPGGSVNYPLWDRKFIKPLYIMHGWPDAFDADAFLIDQSKAYAVVDKESHGKSMLFNIDKCKYSLSLIEDDLIQVTRETIFDNVDALWLSRWKIWDLQRVRIDLEGQLRDAKAEYARPPDPKLWQLEKLRSEARYQPRSLSQPGREDEPPNRWNTPEALRVRRDNDEKQMGIFKRAYEAFRAEIGGDSLFTDRGIVEEDIGDRPGIRPQWRKEEVEAIRAWLLQVSEEAVSTRERAREMMEWHEGGGGKDRPLWTHG